MVKAQMTAVSRKRKVARFLSSLLAIPTDLINCLQTQLGTHAIEELNLPSLYALVVGHLIGAFPVFPASLQLVALD
ncbi:hypothetical protein P7K49_014799 [Saguinus oedipus]|uniref:Uncharacterized protein n=1 Tax=Saguinus oedipus TaxID=9490 RepID=A0ABQ9V890_SAGOE|nr:hypothetical protein P7K49_014799 [Saguinus oedipus]